MAEYLDGAGLAEVWAKVKAADDGVIASSAKIINGYYSGNSAKTRTISLGITPKAVFVYRADGKANYNDCSYSGLAVTGSNAVNRTQTLIGITNGGFTVSVESYGELNKSSYAYHYVAFC